MNKLALFVVLSLIASATIAADQEAAIEQSTDLELTVGAGETWTYDKTITLTDGAKLIKKGSGTLILSYGSNAFDGGIDLQQGVLQADVEGCLGTNIIVLSTTSSRRLVFNAENATFSNDIEQTHAGSYAWNTSLIEVLKTTHLTGNIDSTAGNLCLRVYTSGATLEIDGAVNAGDKNIETDNSTSIIFNGTVTCSELRSGRGYGSKGVVYFNNPVNAIRRIRQDATDVYPGVGGALDGTEFYLQARWYSDSKSGIKLGGNSLTIPCLDANLTNPAINAYANDAGGSIRSTSEATLTITGGVTFAGSDTAYCRYYIGYGSEKINLILDAPNFTQVFMERGDPGSYPNNTTGLIGISNGTFRVTDKVQFPKVPAIAVAEGGTLSSALTNGTAFGGCAAVRIDGTWMVDAGSLLPFAQSAVALEIGPNAEVWLPEGEAFYPASLKIDGETMGPGIYRTGVVKSGALIIPGSSAVWTGEGGYDTSITSAANWGGALPDISFGSAAFRFATGGSVAAVGEPCLFGTTTLSAADGFTFEKADPSATIGISGTLLIEKDESAADDVRSYVFEPPVNLQATTPSLAQTLDVPALDTLAFDGGLTLLGSTATLTKEGAGTVVFGGESVVSGWIKHMEGEMRISGVLGTPNHADQGSSGSWEWTPSLYMDATEGNNQTLVLDGATIEKPFFGRRSTRLFTTVSNTVNVFKGQVTIQDPATDVPAFGKDGELWFEGGISCTWSMTPAGGGTLHICDYKTESLMRTNNIRNINFGDATRVVFEGVQNRIYSGLYFPYTAGVAEFKKSFATVEPIAQFYFGSQYGSGSNTNTLDFGATTQRVVKICHNDAGRTRAEVMTGAPGSLLEITGGADDDSDNVVTWAGGLSLLKTGASQMLMRYSACPSTGDITVTAGELAFVDDASWRSGTNVTVSGTGRLTVTQPDTFGRDITLALNDGGILSVSEGATVYAAKLTVDGSKIGPGCYTYASSPSALKAHLDPAGGGAVLVRGGFMLRVK